MKCLCFPLSINFERFTQELSDYMSCPYKYNQTERELNRFVFNIFITFTLMTQGFARSKVKNDLHRIQGYLVNLLYFLGVMILQFELQKQLFVYRPKQTCPSSCTFLSFLFFIPQSLSLSLNQEVFEQHLCIYRQPGSSHETFHILG